jgi:hypothetical protein
MRDGMAYASNSIVAVSVVGAQDVSVPKPGFYRHRLRSGGIAGAVRIWFGPPHDPETGEEMDRSHRWQAEFLGEYVEFDECWPLCAGDPVSEAEYRTLIARQDWARRNLPTSAYADPRRRYDPLSTREALPF